MSAPPQRPNSDDIVSEIRIAAPRERVFQALADPLQVVQWWGQAGIYRCKQFESHLRVGGAWRSIGVDGSGHDPASISESFVHIRGGRKSRGVLICAPKTRYRVLHEPMPLPYWPSHGQCLSLEILTSDLQPLVY